MYKNHEGYNDPTAGKAVKNANKITRKKKNIWLGYSIGETKVFKDIKEKLRG